MATLGAVLIVKNEEAMLDECLRSLKGVDELVIVDTGSEDRTVEIAGSYTDKVYFSEWKDDFAEARNFALAQSTTDWVLSIDADEVLTPGSLELLRKEIPEAKGSGLVMSLQSSSGEIHRYPRCFKRVGAKWVGRIHEVPDVTQTDKSAARIVYRSSPAHALDPDRSLRMLTKAVEENPDNARDWYYLAREYWYRAQYEKALALWDTYLDKSSFAAERADALLAQARCLWFLQRGEEARQKCALALIANSNFKEAAEFMAEMQWPKNQPGWKAMAEVATNQDVLFVRTRAVRKKPAKIADIIIPHHDRHDLLARCLGDIDNSKFNIIIVSGSSFGENCNRGAKLAQTDRLLFLNDDVVASDDVLTRLSTVDVDLCGVAQKQPGRDALMHGIWTTFKDGLVSASGAFVPELVHVPSGHLFSIRTRCWDRLGGFEEAFRTGYEDVDLGLRAIERGYVLGLIPGVTFHDCSQSAGRYEYARENIEAMRKLWPEERYRRVERMLEIGRRGRGNPV